jgi:ERF superfamily
MRRPSPPPDEPQTDLALADATAGVSPMPAPPVPAGGHASQPSAGASDQVFAIIERAARDESVNIEKLQQLLVMRDRMEDRRARQAFDNAIALAKGEIGPIAKNRAVDFTSQKGRTNYRYEDFAAVAAAVDPVLARYGLSYRFRSEQQGAKLRVTCRISHADGYGEETSLEAANDESGNKNAIQAVGSAATYLQRYTLKLALGLAASNDDDAAVGPAADPVVDADDVIYVETLIRDTESDLPKFLETIGAASIAEMRMSQFKRAIALLNEKKRRAASGATV